MSWGVALWDQFPALGFHTQKSIDFCEKFVHFIKELCAMENDYASKIKRLVKNYQPKKKDESDEEQSYTWMQGFQGMLKEMNDIANQHEIISEELTQRVQSALINLAKELKENRRKALQEQSKQEAMLLQQSQILDKAKKQYEKSYKDGEKSVENYKRIDADQSFPRIDVEKAKNLMHQKLQQCETCKSSYAAELQKTNDAQRDYYSTILPNIILQLQTSEEQRIEQTKRLVQQVADIHFSVMPILQKCIEGIKQSSDLIDNQVDTRLVISRLETGYKPPGDMTFEDLGTPGSRETAENLTQTPNSNNKASRSKSMSMRASTISVNKKSQRGRLPGLFSGSKSEETKDDYSHLPPNQQKKKLQAKIDTLSQAIAKDTAERDGMQKMREVYMQNSKLGDPAAIDKQLLENALKLDRLMLERKKYESFLAEAERKMAEANGNSSPQLQTQISKRPVSTSSATSSINSSSVNSSSVNSSAVNQDLIDGRPDSKPSVTSEDSFDGEEEKDDTAIGYCKARYPFTANSEGSISMDDGEELLIVESDQGDGWTLVRRKGIGEEGFVPTSYIDCHLYR